jgi:hypothetical protein
MASTPRAPERVEELRRAFLTPPGEAYPVIFWLWNGKLEADRVRAQLDDLAAHGFGGVVLHPMGEAFRLADFVAGLEPPYLSEEFFAYVRLAVEHAARLGLQVWLYDEGGWPSGSAQGKVVRGQPQLASRVLTCRPLTPARRPEQRPLLTVGVTPDGHVIYPVSPRQLPAQEIWLLAFEEQVYDDGYPDLLNPEAVQRFIALTHEGYARAVGEYFGTVIPGVFTDEPRVRGEIGGATIPWSPALAQRLEATAPGWQTWLPALFGPEALGFDPFAVLGEAMVVEARCQFASAVAAQFSESYWQQLNEWCAAHGLLHTGHVGGEDNLPDHVRGGFWHWFRTAGTLHAPGVDVIWRQLFPDQPSLSFPQLAASALHQRPGGAAPPAHWRAAPLAVSESYAVYGYGATFAQYAWVANYQFVRGINALWPMAYYYETAHGRAYGTMSHLGPGNPLWRHWRSFNEYLARLAVLVRASGHACDLAVYYPIEAEWAFHGRAQAQRAWQSFEAICDFLHREQVPFDVLDADALAAAEIAEGALTTVGESYSTVIIPACTVLPTEVLAQLWNLHQAGGRVAFLGELPPLSCCRAQQPRHDQLLSAFAEVAFVLSEREEREWWPTALAPVAAGTVPAVWDGATAGLMGPRGAEVFAPAALQPDAVLVAPVQREGARLAHLLSLTLGHYTLEPAQPAPDLRLASRWLTEDVWVHLLFNEGTQELAELPLAVVSEEPLAIEQWSLSEKSWALLALHEQVSEATLLHLSLPPGALAVLVSRPPDASDRQPQPRLPRRPLVLAWLEEAEEAVVIEQCRLENGTLRRAETWAPLPRTALGRWQDAGAPGLCGTVRYRLTLPLADAYLDAELWLELGEVEYAATVYLNGERLADCLWPPYRVLVSGRLHAGFNELVVEVTNTLAAEILRPENVAQAEQQKWNNPYYRRVLRWHRESLGGGLLGPVQLIALR